MTGVFVVPVLSLSWAVVLAAPFLLRARRVRPAYRVRALRRQSPGPAAHPGARRLSVPAGWHQLAVVRVFLAPVARRRSANEAAALVRELPVAIDLLGVAVGAGCTPFLAVQHAARWAPPVIAVAFDGVVRACGLGAGFADAWRDAAARSPQLQPLADALTAGERTGAPVGPALARLAAEERAASRRRVESHARRVPVRLLFPLVFLVLPAFVVLTVVPGVAAGLGRL